MKRVWVIVGVVLLLCIAGVVNGLIISSQDAPPPDASSLAITRPDVPDRENAYTYFTAATNYLYESTNYSLASDYLAGRTVNQTDVDQLINSNAQMFASVSRGLSCDILLAPTIDGYQSSLGYIVGWRNMARVMAVRARRDRIEGKYSDATDMCISILKFADLVQHNPGCIIHYLVGLAVADMGGRQAMDLARDRATPVADLTRLLEALADPGTFDHGLILAIKQEHRMTVKIIDSIHDGTMTWADISGYFGSGSSLARARLPAYFLHPNRTKEMFVRYYSNAASNAPLHYSHMTILNYEDVFGPDGGDFWNVARPNAFGRMLGSMLCAGTSSLLMRKCRTDCNVAGVRAITACNLYVRAHGELPVSLPQLVPEYLSDVPLDPFDGKPMRYIAATGIVYSVGSDLIDSGGSLNGLESWSRDDPWGRRWQAADAVFHVTTEGEASSALVKEEEEP